MKELFEKNVEWAEAVKKNDPTFFEQLSKQQAPEYLWIGCSDSRVPANEIVGLMPGELFVHRNVANMVVHSDLNCLSVIQYAVEYLQVKHVIVCGHYGCGGVRASVERKRLGLIDNWLLNVQDVQYIHQAYPSDDGDKTDIVNQVCELNVVEQVVNVCKTNIIKDAWMRGQDLTVHGWIYSIADGLLKDLGVNITHLEDMRPKYHQAIEDINQRYV
ncbi:MAG: carbonate dehydratase [Porticoccaceae bacterium]|nr:MAG: carbonate dehydratase [Porticoccaceae bacterium]PCJ94358.1 MAG: carbonate dehydratase [Porticoccaceae bacterium]